VTRTANNSRYSDYATIFGNEFLTAAFGVNTFLVGAGALGCEFIKMFSLMGVGVKGKVSVTDDDNI
jgi:ubiquitin-activating enzyme E1